MYPILLSHPIGTPPLPDTQSFLIREARNVNPRAAECKERVWRMVSICLNVQAINIALQHYGVGACVSFCTVNILTAGSLCSTPVIHTCPWRHKQINSLLIITYNNIDFLLPPHFIKLRLGRKGVVGRLLRNEQRFRPVVDQEYAELLNWGPLPDV